VLEAERNVLLRLPQVLFDYGVVHGTIKLRMAGFGKAAKTLEVQAP
jgi:hypothetical protein